jgi:hypothetical protein
MASRKGAREWYELIIRRQELNLEATKKTKKKSPADKTEAKPLRSLPYPIPRERINFPIAIAFIDWVLFIAHWDEEQESID